MTEIKRKETIRISKKDLTRLLTENEQLAQHVTELQIRLNELLEENRQLKASLEHSQDYSEEGMPEDFGPGPGRSPDPFDPLPTWGPDVYIDGASKFRNND